MYKIFGISNCDSVKKAKDLFHQNDIGFYFVDFKKYRPTDDDIARWAKSFKGLPVNVKGITYKKHKEYFEKLSELEKVSFIKENTSMIKRPILERENQVLAFGFDEDQYKMILNKN